MLHRVNSTTLVSRTVDEIKKKWADIQSLTKKKEGERRRSMSKTGGGPAPEFYFKEWEKVVTTRAVYVTLLIDCIIFLNCFNTPCFNCCACMFVVPPHSYLFIITCC